MTIETKHIETHIPLTQSQLMLWIGQKLNFESPMYNMAHSFEINVAIDEQVFKKAFQDLIDSVDVFRITFGEEKGIPFQNILERFDYNLSIEDLSNRSSFDLELALQKRTMQLFDLSVPLFDSALYKLDKTRYVWFLNMHHLVTDATSSTIFFKNFIKIYKRNLESQNAILLEIPQYRDYLKYEKNITEDISKDDIRKYWLVTASKIITPPVLYGENGKQITSLSNRITVKLSETRVTKLSEFANRTEIRCWTKDLTYFNIFLTSLFIYIKRISNAEKLAIGALSHSRVTNEFKKTAGMFVELFPLVAEFSEEDTFLTIYNKVRNETNEFLRHAQPGMASAEASSGFNVVLNYIKASFSDFNGSPVKSKWIHPNHSDAAHHMRCSVYDMDGTGDIELFFDLNTRVFDAEKQQQVPQHFLKVLDAFIDNPVQEIDTISLITETEILKIKTWNNTSVIYPKDETLLSKFESQVLKTPNKIAIVFKETSLTYQELDEKSNQVACFLIEKGIQLNDIVVVSLNRSLEMMIYIYGIIKAGAAYLPVDVSIPAERLEFILNDSKSKILFYNHNNIISKVKNIDFFHVEAIAEQVFFTEGTPSLVKISPDDLAYIIYTSGSTGTPKGVKCHHEGICNRLNWMNNDYAITTDDTFIQKTPITFDVSLWELFWPLQEGAKLAIEVPDGHMNPHGLIDTIRHHQVTNIHFVPSMLNVFIQTEGVENCTSLNRIFCSGEALSISVVEKTYDKLNIELHNLYGPTEASVDVTSWHCKKTDIYNGIPIGKPVANTQLYILDEKLNQLPIGLKGELYISGKQVAKGYLNRETLTNERFVKDIFSDDPNVKMYRTGDLVRQREDGIIEYHGRIDNQIKLRGLRIELGEIEKNIEKLTSITQAVVSLDNQNNLVAYYTGEKTEEFTIVNALVSRLPQYMIPQFYMHLEHFELLSSGKVNRKKLPERDTFVKVEKAETKIAPRNEIEEIVYDVWEEVLGIEQIGVNENFIRIGGNSLNAISITSRLKAMLELDVSITDVFNYPSIAAYADNVERVITELLDN